MIKVNSLAGYWREVKRLNDELKSDEMLFFRGYSNCAYILLPSCMREPSPAKEDEEYHNILIEYPEEFRKGEHLSNLVKMQHYGAATRLLDFSRNPLISLYFAVESNKNADGEVLCVKVKKSEILHHTSDKALMLACLPPFTDEEKRHIKRFCECHRGLIDDKVIERDDSTGIMKRFLHEMRVLQEIHHPNLPRTFRISGASPVYAVLEYCRTGSCVRSLPDSSGFLAALRFLHAKNILHGDIRLSNLGVRRDGTPVLLDFSHSRRVDGAELLREASGETERIKKLMSA